MYLILLVSGNFNYSNPTEMRTPLYSRHPSIQDTPLVRGLLYSGHPCIQDTPLFRTPPVFRTLLYSGHPSIQDTPVLTTTLRTSHITNTPVLRILKNVPKCVKINSWNEDTPLLFLVFVNFVPEQRDSSTCVAINYYPLFTFLFDIM